VAIVNEMTELIGNTPLLRLDPERHRLPRVELYAKLEFLNPFGSVKDRIAWGMVRDDLPEIVARRQSLIEASSGNTAKALQVIAGLHGLHLRVLTNRTKVTEVRHVLELLGGELEELPGLSECPDPTAPNDVFSTIEQMMAAEPGHYHHTSQYTNEANLRTHRDTTGLEIQTDLGHVDYLFGGLGTTGSTRGTATALLPHNPGLSTVGIVSTTDDFIPGIRSEAEMWEVGLFDRDFYTTIMPVRSADAIDATVDLARNHGVLAGPTSGASYWAVRDHLSRSPVPEGRTATVVFIACDRIEWYLSYFRARRPDLFGRARRPTPADLDAESVRRADRITPSELADRLDDGRHLLVDLRTELAFRIGHVPGSVNIRDDVLDEMLRHANPFPASRRVVLVCPVGELARRPAAFLARQGQPAAALDGGVIAWRDAGLPLESGLSRAEVRR
jgi:cysteine synthase B